KICGQGVLRGRVEAPVSKSSQQRAIACALLSTGVSRLSASNSSSPLCADSAAALKLAEDAGAEVSIASEHIEISGIGGKSVLVDSTNIPRRFSCGESGLCMRMFAPVMALSPHAFFLDAEGSLQHRPMGMVQEALSSMGVSCGSSGGFPPLKIQGPLRGGDYRIDASKSSQFLTGMLVALPLASEDSVLRATNPVSRGYLDLTIATCQAFGVDIQRSENFQEFRIEGRQTYKARDFKVEGDWSGAAFLVCAGAIAGEALRIGGLSMESAQPDKAVVTAVQVAGVEISWEKASCSEDLVVRQGVLRAFDFDATDCPDLFPPLAVLAAACPGTSRVKGIHRLRAKESDRAASIAAMLEGLGISVILSEDYMVITGGQIMGGRVEAFGDHRIAMAAAIAALIARDPVSISGAECVAKSWPDFFETLESLLFRDVHP
ncbi:MAG: 3-phosphoshikimate 1-carboxyvinyltransferase, partial [Spirochaetes bacterium]